MAYLIDNPANISLISNETSGVVGHLEVNIIPVDENGWDDVPEDMIPDEPEDLLG